MMKRYSDYRKEAKARGMASMSVDKFAAMWRKHNKVEVMEADAFMGKDEEADTSSVSGFDEVVEFLNDNFEKGGNGDRMEANEIYRIASESVKISHISFIRIADGLFGKCKPMRIGYATVRGYHVKPKG